jgi:hypothetical protein
MYQTHSFLKLNATAVILVTLKQIVLVLYNLLKKIWLLWSRWLITSAVTHDDDRVRGWHLRTGSSWLLCALLGRRWLLFCRFFLKNVHLLHHGMPFSKIVVLMVSLERHWLFTFVMAVRDGSSWTERDCVFRFYIIYILFKDFSSFVLVENPYFECRSEIFLFCRWLL